MGQALHLLGPRRGPHERLTIGADLRHDLPHLRLETHVQHAVCLIQHQVRDTAQVGRARLQEVDESAGGADHDLAATLQVTGLGPLGHAAIHACKRSTATPHGNDAQDTHQPFNTACNYDAAGHRRHGDTHTPNEGDSKVASTHSLTRVLDGGGGAELGTLLLNLDSQLSGRRQNEDDGPIAGLQVRLRVDVHDRRQQERQRLAGTRLRDADEVPTWTFRHTKHGQAGDAPHLAQHTLTSKHYGHTAARR